MKRRDFLNKSVSAGLAAGAAFTLLPYRKLMAGEKTSSAAYDMVAIRGGEADAMFDRAIQSLGGIRNFVKTNQTVVVKPNIGWDSTPERAADTNPRLVGRIAAHCISAGAKEVYVFDHTCNTWTRCYKNSGIEKAAKDAGATVVTGNSEKYYHEVDIPGGVKLKKAKVHELVLESDVFINVPVLKNHGGASMTVAMKNLMGIVWDRRYWHANDLHQCIADFTTFRQPDLNVVDAYRVMKRNGPRGVSVNDVVTMKSQILSTDILAADVAAIKLFGKEPGQVGYINKAKALNAGVSDLSKLNIDRIKI